MDSETGSVPVRGSVSMCAAAEGGEPGERPSGASARISVEALALVTNLRTRHNSRLRPLSASSLRRLIMTLNAILDEAVDDAKVPVNPARGRRMRIKVPRPAARCWRSTS